MLSMSVALFASENSTTWVTRLHPTQQQATLVCSYDSTRVLILMSLKPLQINKNSNSTISIKISFSEPNLKKLIEKIYVYLKAGNYLT